LTALSHFVGTDAATGASVSSSLSWYALRVFSNRERAVKRTLHQLEYGAFLPVYSERVQWSDRIKIAEKLLFPGYIFTRMPAEALAAALEIPGVLQALPSNLRPLPVADSEIANLHRVMASLLPLSPADYLAGDKVTIKSGALRGVSGVVQRHAGGARLIVSVEMLNRAVSVELDADALAKEK
jgi:transcription antitermination factor NusG